MNSIIRLLRHPAGLWIPLIVHRLVAKFKYVQTLYRTSCTRTYHDETHIRLICSLPAAPLEFISSGYPWLADITKLHANHRFDWLGLDWQDVGYSAISPGLAGVRYEAPEIPVNASGTWLTSYVSSHNLQESQRLWTKLQPRYQPIDWQRDHRSGYRWQMATPSVKLSIYPQLGADIKQPWELARLQHLPLLALAYSGAKNSLPGFDTPEFYLREFQNVIFDFLATNPPQFGVHWICSMDVAIRIVNVLVARDIFIASGAVFDDSFEALLARTTLEHAEHVRHHLERRPDFKANHYLANIAGLLFCAFYLGNHETARVLWRFASKEFKKEVVSQFHDDGTNFEASTAYHRLSGEIVVWSLALISKVEGPSAITAELLTRLNGIGKFIRDYSKSDDIAIPIGDLDNGRFLKISSDFSSKGSALKDLVTNAEHQLWHENLEHHTHLQHATDAFFERNTRNGLESWILQQWIGEQFPRPQLPHVSMLTSQWSSLLDDYHFVHQQEYSWRLPGEDAPELSAYPKFGLYIVRAKRWLITIRCGSNGQNGNGGHAHNDQLSMTLEVDGNWLVPDSGMALYNAIPRIRKAYRSVSAHFAPQISKAEPASLELDPFRLSSVGEGKCLHFSSAGFAGVHEGFGFRVGRWITWQSGVLTINDYSENNSLVNLCEHPFQLDGGVWKPPVPVATSYGRFPENFFI